MEKVLKHYYQHVDNGGVTVSIVDKFDKVQNKSGDIVFRVSASYFGYPSITSEIPIGMLGKDWLQKIGLMLIEAQSEISKIDFKERYEAL